MEMQTFTVQPKDYGLRLDVFLANSVPTLTRSRLKKETDNGNVTVNGAVVKAGYTLKAGDTVSFTLPDPTPVEAAPLDIPLSVIYQDDDLAVINKPQGLTVHAGNGTGKETLVNALLFHLDKLSGVGGKLRPGIVHRIDKNTSGVLLVAKNDSAHVHLSKQIEKKTCKRKYLALLEGKLKTSTGRIETYLTRDNKNRTKYTVSFSTGKKAITDYRVVKVYENYTLCEFSLQTGRTHQIRVHAKHLGHPVVGDPEYGYAKQKFHLEGQLLHAYEITFQHPTTGKEMSFSAPLPAYFQQVLEKLK